MREAAVVVAALTSLLTSMIASPVQSLAATRLLENKVVSDFNGDGFSDLAVGSPFANEMAGIVSVLYGSEGGLTASGSQVWSQESPGVHDDAEFKDFFGWSVATGDFNGDGLSDLAVGVQGEDQFDGDSNEIVDVGAVHVLYGSVEGLTSVGSQFWSLDSPGIAGQARSGDFFGWKLSAADFGWDSSADLAIASSHGAGGNPGAGTLSVLYGSTSGLSAESSQLWSRATPGIKGGVKGTHWFGYALAAGDFGDDSHADIAVHVETTDFSGAVHVIFGGDRGLVAEGNELWTPASLSLLGDAAKTFAFGGSLAAGNFDGDGKDELAIGAYAESVNAQDSAGAVHILTGAPGGLSADDDQRLTQDTQGIEDRAEVEDFFGVELAAGQFGNGPEEDLAIGVSSEDLAGNDDAGLVHLIYGAPHGLGTRGSQVWSQAGDQLRTRPETADFLGETLTSGFFDGDDYADLVIGVPLEDWAGMRDAGLVHLLRGSRLGLTGTDAQNWDQSNSLADLNENGSGDGFGSALSIGL